MTKKNRILIVDDEQRNRNLLQAMLKSMGHESDVACDGFEALCKVGDGFDLVFMDVMMPGIDGFEACRRMREKDGCTDIPIIMVTVLTSKEDRLRAVEAGANDFISKPIDKVELRIRTRSLLKMKEAQDAIKAHKAHLESEVEKRTAALQQSELRYRTLFRDSLDAICVVGKDGSIVYVNPAFLDLFGFSEDEILRTGTRDLFVDPVEVLSFTEKLARSGSVKDYEIKLRNKEGSWRDCLITASLRKERDGSFGGFQGIIRNVTEIKRAEKERLRLVTAVEQANETIVITDTEGTIVYANPAFERTTGFSRTDALGMDTRTLNSGKHDKSFYKTLWDTISSGRVWRGHFINKKKDGTLYHEEASITPVKDRSGEIVNYVAVKRDVTNELVLEKQLRQAQKMEAIGTLAGGIAHDFNNILYGISGFAELALESTEEESENRLYVERILQAASRATGVVNQILAFCREGEHERSPIDVTPIAKETAKFLRASVPTTVEIRLRLDDDPGKVLADPTQIHQMLMNLCTNAFHAMRESGGVLTVAVEKVDIDEKTAASHRDLNQGSYTAISVSDTGHGMSPEIQERIFDPYFTTKNHGEGTGLGLAMVHGTVQSHDGCIIVESKPNKGSTFRILLPVVLHDLGAESEGEAALPTGNETILLVDDEPALVEMGEQLLGSLGYHVIGETSPIEALKRFRAQPDYFDLVITDMTMPLVTGAKLAHEVLTVRPNIPVILCTGFSSVMTEARASSLGIRALMMKPMLKSKMANTIRRALDSSLDQGDPVHGTYSCHR